MRVPDGVGQDERTLAVYAALTVSFLGALGGFVATRRGRLPERLSWDDVARITLTTYKVSRIVSRDEVTSFVRAPLTTDEEATEPKERGVAGAFGNLLTCPYCVGLWVAATASVSQALAPRPTRFLTSVFCAHALADFLHAGFVRLRG